MLFGSFEKLYGRNMHNCLDDESLSDRHVELTKTCTQNFFGKISHISQLATVCLVA